MDDAPMVLSVARGYVKSFGKAAPRKLRQFARAADKRGDMVSAETWRDLADAAQLILSRPRLESR
jgi:hypothetical protein